MNRNKRYHLLLLLLFLIDFLLLPYLHANTDFEIGIESGTAIIWEYSEINEDIMEDLVNQEGYNEDYLSLSEGDQIRWDIYQIDPYSDSNTDYHEVFLYWFEGTNLDTETGEYIGDYYTHVGMNASFVGDQYYTEDSDYSFSPTYIICAPVNQYLTELITGFPESKQALYSVEGFSLIIDFTKKDGGDKIVITYNTQGVQETYQVFWEDNLAFKRELIGVIDSSINPDNIDLYIDNQEAGDGEEEDEVPIFIIMIIIMASNLGVCLACTFVRKIRYSKKSEEIKSSIATHAPLEIESPSRVYSGISQESADDEVHFEGYCSLCGAKRDPDAQYCPECGNKY